MFTKEIVLNLPVPRRFDLSTNYSYVFSETIFISLQNVDSYLNQTFNVDNFIVIVPYWSWQIQLFLFTAATRINLNFLLTYSNVDQFPGIGPSYQCAIVERRCTTP